MVRPTGLEPEGVLPILGKRLYNGKYLESRLNLWIGMFSKQLAWVEFI